MGLYQITQEACQEKIAQIPTLLTGDALSVGILLTSTPKTRIVYYKGTLISKKGRGRNKTITVRRVTHGVGMERVFFVNAPSIQCITVLRRSVVRRAKLYYLRNRVGKAARLRERVKRKYL